MHLYKQKRFSYRGILLMVAVFAAVAGIFLYGFFDATSTIESQQKALLEKAIDRSIVNCYAIEGSYPESIAYLEEHYGVVIDHEKYYVDYEAIGSNVKPTVIIAERGEGEQHAQQIPLD